jgi:hypothetical protein
MSLFCTTGAAWSPPRVPSCCETKMLLQGQGIRRQASHTANQLLPPNPASVKDASSSSSLSSSRGGEAPAVSRAAATATAAAAGPPWSRATALRGGVPMQLGAFVVAAPAASAGPGVTAAASFVGAAADVALSKLPAKVPKKAVFSVPRSDVPTSQMGRSYSHTFYLYKDCA